MCALKDNVMWQCFFYCYNNISAKFINVSKMDVLLNLGFIPNIIIPNIFYLFEYNKHLLKIYTDILPHFL